MPLNPSSFSTTSPLTNISIKHSNELEGYVTDEIFPPLVVSKNVGKFYVYGKENLRNEGVDAPSGTEAPSGEYSVFTKSYALVEKAFKGLVKEKDARDFDTAVADLDVAQAMHNQEILMNAREIQMYTKVSTTGNYPSAHVATLTDNVDRWSDSGGDPLDDVREIREAVYASCGKYPNRMAISQKGLDYLKLHPSLVDRVKYTTPEVATQVIASLMGLEKIVVAKASKNTANEGAADSLGSIWGDSALVYFHNPSAGLRSMSYGRQFIGQNMYSKVLDAPQLGRSLGAHWVENGWEFCLEFLAVVSSANGDSTAGGLITNIF